MNAQKSIAVVTAMLITAAGMAGIVNYTNAAASAADHGIDATSQVIRTLPTINVHPSNKQMRELRGDQPGSRPRTCGCPTTRSPATLPALDPILKGPRMIGARVKPQPAGPKP